MEINGVLHDIQAINGRVPSLSAVETAKKATDFETEIDFAATTSADSYSSYTLGHLRSHRHVGIRRRQLDLRPALPVVGTAKEGGRFIARQDDVQVRRIPDQRPNRVIWNRRGEPTPAVAAIIAAKYSVLRADEDSLRLPRIGEDRMDFGRIFERSIDAPPLAPVFAAIEASADEAAFVRVSRHPSI